MSDQKVAVITAGGSGMGADAARRLAQDGFNVAILSSSGKGEALAKELGGIGVTGSNQSNDDLKSLVDQTVEKWGRIDVLVNSAGHGPRAPILELTDEDWHAGMDVYLMNVVRPTRLVAPVIAVGKMTSTQLQRTMQANFHSALDARYAVRGGVLYSAFIHPLSPLSDDEVRSGLMQVVNLVKTFGTTYSSGGLFFGKPGARKPKRPTGPTTDI